MERLRDYDVLFSGLKSGNHEFDFEIKPTFFDIYDDAVQEFRNAKGNAHVRLEKQNTFLKFFISVSVLVELDCDVCNEAFDYLIQNELNLLVNFAHEYDNSNDDVINIPFGENAFNVAQFIYEAVVLSVPMKKISPQYEKNKNDFENLLEHYAPKTSNQEETNHNPSIDPRWIALNNLKNK